MTDKKKDRPFVFVRCMTFNHEAYIEDALNGFVMQETNFPFVVTIVNDASPDNTRQVLDNYIKENCILENVEHANTDYADIITAIPTQNTNCLLYILNLHENHFGKKSHRPYYQHFVDKAKYWAECEGDDYWTDPLKLQKQVEFMEANLDYGLCYAKARIYNQENSKYVGIKGSPVAEKYELSIMGSHQIATPTALMRKDVYDQCFKECEYIRNRGCFTDSSIWWWFAANSKLCFMNEIFAVYRELPESASHSRDIRIIKDRLNIALRVKLFFLLKYPIKDDSFLESIIEDYLSFIENYSHYHGFVVEQKVRQSKRYRIGNAICKILSLKSQNNA